MAEKRTRGALSVRTVDGEVPAARGLSKIAQLCAAFLHLVVEARSSTPRCTAWRRGLLSREDRLEGGRVRKYYAATEKGMVELDHVRDMIRELYREVIEGEGPDPD